MPIEALDHVDLAVGDLERSLAFYLALLGPLGAEVATRFPAYRGTAEVVYIRTGGQYLGISPVDGGEHRSNEVGLEHLAFVVDTRQEVETYARCVDLGVNVHVPPSADRDITGYWELFFFVDPDGLRIEVAYSPPEEPATSQG